MSLRVKERAERLVLAGDAYRLEVATSVPVLDVFLLDRHVAHVPLSVTTSAADTETRLAPARWQRIGGAVSVEWAGQSAQWRRKILDLRAEASCFSLGLRVEGSGTLDTLHFLGEKGTWTAFTRLFNPAPALGRQQVTDSSQSAAISIGQHDSGWFFTPAPFAFALAAGEHAWLGVGILAAPGGWRFSELKWPGGAAGFGLSLAYDGQTHVEGWWQSPRLVCLPSSDPYEALERYTAYLRATGLTPDPGRGSTPAWWREPIFCGWGEQVALQTLRGGRAADYATQANYERWLGVLEQHGLDPGTVIVDDKWQRAYGLNDVDPAKWPDLRGFIARQHARGRHVLLWLKAWDPEGLPADECILTSDGVPVAADPGSSTYASRLWRQIQHLVRAVGADGFKVDFTQSIPRGPGSQGSAGGLWGLELQRQWLTIVAQAARAAKPDALLEAHTANPYLADLVDVLRLNDVPAWSYADHTQSILPDMRHRARVARAASPDWLLDSDNWPMCSRAQLRDYARAQGSGELGIPSLYYAEHLEWAGRVERLEDQDYAALRDAWARYRAGLGPISMS